MAVLKTVLVLLSILFVSKVKSAPPQIPETFSADINVERNIGGYTYFGSGILARDQANKKGVENYNISVGANTEQSYLLERYDMNPQTEYRIRGIIPNNPHLQQCHSNNELDITYTALPQYFAWVANAAYVRGGLIVEHLTSDLYVAEFAGTKLSLGVDPDNNKPLILKRATVGEEFILTFKTFNTTTVNAAFFDVPQICLE